MNAKELRLGNFFIEVNSKEIIEVISLEKDKITFSSYFLGEWQALPITLTEEWLLKFGFKKYRECFCKEYKNQGEFLLFSNKTPTALANGVEDPFYFTFKTIKGIRFVHQLQNLYLALTGDELNVK